MIKSAGVLLLALILFFSPQIIDAQCCSTGSPVGASVYVGVLGKDYLRLITFYRHSYSDKYFENDSRADNNPLQSANYNFGGLTLGYGVTKRLTVEMDFGYFLNKTQVYLNYNIPKTTGFGFSGGGFNLKYGLFVKPVKQIELTAGAGFRYPFTTKRQIINGLQLNPDIQPSTNAYGLNGMLFFSIGFPAISMRLFTNNRYDYNFADPVNYKYGNILLNSVFVSKKLVKYFFAILQLRNEYKTRDKYKRPDQVNAGYQDQPDTGYDIFYICPQLSYAFAGKWNVTVVCDLPLYKYYKDRQMTPSYTYAISLSRDFNLGRKAPKVEPARVDSN